VYIEQVGSSPDTRRLDSQPWIPSALELSAAARSAVSWSCLILLNVARHLNGRRHRSEATTEFPLSPIGVSLRSSPRWEGLPPPEVNAYTPVAPVRLPRAGDCENWVQQSSALLPPATQAVGSGPPSSPIPRGVSGGGWTGTPPYGTRGVAHRADESRSRNRSLVAEHDEDEGHPTRGCRDGQEVSGCHSTHAGP
jgi:hypothetical protein